MFNKKEKKQKYREIRLVRRLVDGLAGWLTFKQAGGAKTLYSEHFLYPAIYEIASGLRWAVLAQEPIIKSTSRKGPPRTLDFVFYERRRPSVENLPGLIIMEVKYLRGENTTQELYGLHADFKKIRSVAPTELANERLVSKCGPPGRWQMIVAQRGAYDKLSRSNSKKFSPISKLLTSASSGRSNHPPNLIVRALIETKLKSQFHWHVVAIAGEKWPTHI